MDRISIPSDDVKSAGYDSKQMILEIEIKPDGIIQFFKVPEKVYTGLLNAKEHKTYYLDKIKYIYRYQRVE